MTSVTNSSGLNYQNGINPLGRKVRALESAVDTLQKELLLLKAGGVSSGSTASVQSAPSVPSVQSVQSPALAAEIDALKRDIAILKATTQQKGEKGDRGEKGEKGDKGDTGPITYIAMPAAAVPSVAPTTA